MFNKVPRLSKLCKKVNKYLFLNNKQVMQSRIYMYAAVGEAGTTPTCLC